ncbi:MAG: hypothetical protein ACUVX8_14665, partial [Candidatus Zipacnadales bacterium]
MYNHLVLLIIGAVLWFVATRCIAQATVWVADPLVKTFREDVPRGDALNRIIIRAAQGEIESAQVCVRSTEPLRQL